MQIGSLPRIRLTSLPTPLEPAPRLGASLGIDLYVKRDDATSLALGGNKVRKLEFSMAKAKAQGCDTVITTGAVQSNHTRMTAAAARRLGMTPVLLLEGTEPQGRQGNLLLDHLFGAEVSYLPDGADLERESARAAEEQRALGRKPYVIPWGGSNPVACVGYLLGAVELVQQAVDAGISVRHVFMAAGSCGTLAGFALGMKALSPGTKVWGISISRSAAGVREAVSRLSAGAARLVGMGAGLEPEEVLADDSYLGDGYGVPTKEGLEAIRLAASTEGLILDPVYTGKAMAGLVDYARRGRIGRGETVVFVHTGGAAGLFAHANLF